MSQMLLFVIDFSGAVKKRHTLVSPLDCFGEQAAKCNN